MNRTRDGVHGCRCCGLKHPDENGYCDICVSRGHDKIPLPERPVEGEHRQQEDPPHDRQIKEPRRNR